MQGLASAIFQGIAVTTELESQASLAVVLGLAFSAEKDNVYHRTDLNINGTTAD
jgi:hypothetical protein